MKVLMSSVARRKYCTLECPFADMCPTLPLAMSAPPLENGKQPCKLKDAPKAIQRRIQNMFLNGEEGLLLEIKQTLFVTSTRLGDDNKERMAYADSLMRLHKACYGEKSQLANSPEPLNITVRQLMVKPDGSQSAQEIKMTRQDNAEYLLKGITKADETPPDEGDPESLMTSPVLDVILHAPKREE